MGLVTFSSFPHLLPPPPPHPEPLDELTTGYPGLIWCGHCQGWNTKFALDCRHCGDELSGGNNNSKNNTNETPATSIVCNYDGVPLFSLAGENLLPDRLYPAGWKCCGCRTYNMIDRLEDGSKRPGATGLWRCASRHDHCQSLNSTDSQKGEQQQQQLVPQHPVEFCPSCYVVNRYHDPLVYMGDGPQRKGKKKGGQMATTTAKRGSSLLLVKDGPLYLHDSFLQNAMATDSRRLLSLESAAQMEKDTLSLISRWLVGLWAERDTSAAGGLAVPTTRAVKTKKVIHGPALGRPPCDCDGGDGLRTPQAVLKAASITSKKNCTRITTPDEDEDELVLDCIIVAG